MIYGNTQTKTLRNDLFVFEIYFAIHYVCLKRALSRRTDILFVSMQDRTLYMKPYVHFIVAGDVISHKSILVQDSVFLFS